MLTHTVEGMSANPGLQEVATDCNEIKQRLKAGYHHVAEPLHRLSNHLEAVMDEILMLEDGAGLALLTPPSGAIDAAKLLPLLDRMIEILNRYELNDQAVNQLWKTLDPGRFKPLEALIDAFEFEQASAYAQELRTAIQTPRDHGE